MRKILLFALHFTLLVSLGCKGGGASSATSSTDDTPDGDNTNGADNVLIIGDSLSVPYGVSPSLGWPQLLEDKMLNESYGQNLVNASVTGQTTSGAVVQFHNWLTKYKPKLVIITLGTNDAINGVSLTTVDTNLHKLVEDSQDAGAIVVLMRVHVILTSMANPYRTNFEAIYDDLAAANTDVIYAPNLLDQFTFNMSYYQSDGKHPNASAQPLILDTLWPSIQSGLDLIE